MTNIDELFNNFEKKCGGIVNNFQSDLDEIQLGGLNPGVIEKISVNVYDNKYLIRDLATVSKLDQRTLSIKVWDGKNANAIEKAIFLSDLDLSPIKEGSLIRIPIAPLTTEKREKMIKLISSKAEQFKVSIRNARHSYIDELKKQKKLIAKDDYNNFIKTIDKTTKNFIEKIDQILHKKKIVISNK